MESYVRNPTLCMSYCRGFEKPEISLALLSMIDYMALHIDDHGGIPREPTSYIAGLLGVGPRKWTQVIEPALLKSKRVQKATLNGIKVWVFPDDQMRGPKALFKPVPKPMWPERFPHDINPRTPEEETQWRHLHLAEFKPDPAKYQTEDAKPNGAMGDPLQEVGRYTCGCRREMHPPNECHKAVEPTPPPAISEIVPPSMPMPAVIEDTTPVPDVPSHTAYEVLRQAGVDVDNHERGELFWMRTEHGEVLSRWLETVPINEIVVRIDKARIAGNLPKSPNGLLAYENIVLGG